MSRHVLLGLFIPIAIVLAWWGGYSLYGNSGSQGSIPNVATDVNVTPSERADPTPDIPQNDTDDLQSDSALGYLGWEVSEEADAPTVCFSFYSPLNKNDAVAIRDYFRISPNASVASNIEGHDLCLSGFEFDQDYSVTLLDGLPGADNKSLSRDIEETISFGDKPPYVAFAGQGIILPRINAQGLAIESVNVASVEVTIARVNDRIIARRDPQSGEVTLEGDYSWQYENAATSVRETVWTGTFPVQSERNYKVTTVIPFAEYTGDLDPGAYVVTVERAHEDNESQVAKAWRWIISTDIALTSYRGDGGLTVSARSLDSAKLLRDVDVTLVAENNDILAQSRTDASGHVTFAAPLLAGQGAKRAKMVMAYGADNDYALLDLSRAPHDLSEYDIAGRTVSGPVDMYGFTERGVYRPGETAHATVMLRDNQAKAIMDRPAKLIVRRPNGIEMFTQIVSAKEIADMAGTINWAYDIPTSAPRGVWSIDVEAEGAGQVGRIEFSVEDFVPQKLKLDIKVDDSPVGANDVRPVTVDAQFLYGAPGAALEAEAEARLRIDPKPFADFADYTFGPADRDFSERFIVLGGGLTDGRGQLELPLNMRDENIASPFPLRAEITAGVAEPGGRYVRDSVRIPVRTEDSYIGLKPLYDGSRVPHGKPADLSLVALTRDGKLMSGDLSWSLIEEDWDYHWYRERGRWRYRRDVRDIPVTSGTLTLDGNAAATWSRQLSWGDYRLDVTSADGAVAGYRFSVGWGRAERSDSPDQIRVGGPETAVKAGDMINLSVNAPYAGEAELVIANDQVRMVKPLTLAQGASDLTFKFEPAWGDSIYAMLTLYTPRDTANRPIPRRAVGISYIALDRSAQTLELDIESQDVLRPRTSHEFIVNVANAPRGDTVWMNFAAVDEGILQITKYKSPDADDFFFGKKALNVEIRDDYGRVLNANLGDPALANSGGDSLGGEGLTVVPTKTVALFEGAVKVRNGTAKIEMDLPDFNGELRLMATAWSKSAVGSASSSAKIRDKVPAIVALPRFLAPGDQAVATISLDNVEGAAGSYDANLVAGTGISSGDGISLDLTQGQRLEEVISLAAQDVGVTDLKFNVSGPDGYRISSDYPIEVRSPFLPITQSELTQIAPGETFTLSPDLIQGYVPGSTDITVSFSNLPGLDATPYVKALVRYPYGCTEQTVSVAMPLLYAADLGGIPGQSEVERRRNLQKSVSRLASRQGSDGAFGLWREGDRYASPWLGVYTTDFLYRAKQEGLYVSPDVLRRAKLALSELSRMPRYPNLQYRFPENRAESDRAKAEAAAYAHFVLARENQGNLGQMRYIFDNHLGKIRSPLAHAYLGGALAMMGDKARAKTAFDTAQRSLGYEDRNDYYQSSVRDIGGMIDAATQADRSDFAIDLADSFRNELDDETYLNTQEKAHVVLALKALMSTIDAPDIKAQGVSLTDGKQPSATMYGVALADGPRFTNQADAPVWASVTVSGAPSEAPLPVNEGITATKQVFTMAGQTADLTQATQGDRFVVRIDFNSNMNRSRTVVLADLLPAGFEIETVLRPEDGRNGSSENGPYAWVGNISGFQVTEARDDRFIASLETYRRTEYVAAYIVRAVTPGDFAMPGVVIEDMYRPEDHAITPSGRVKILSDPSL